ncbi:MAG: DEAD/DEAH box helicase family protein [Sedimentitalea sp.]|nr:DEAD/DEAH box helicase family protein [Sedimentitalea sp.]
MLRWFVVFEDDGKGAIKKAAGYHQFHAVRKAVGSILAARNFDGKGGVIWHTQGSGKSLLMAFLAGRVMHLPELENPTLVILTDRNDLDNQLFGTFGRCRDLLGEDPVQVESIEDLKIQLDRQVGGVVFSTIQKFRPEKGNEFPELTARSNVIVMVDEAHRTQYGFDARVDEASGDMRRGLAHHLRMALPNAVYVAFTQAHRSSSSVPIRDRCSAITLMSTISPRRSRTARQCQSTMKGGSRGSRSMTMCRRSSMRNSKRSRRRLPRPRPMRQPAGGRGSRLWWAPRNDWTRWSQISSSILMPGFRRSMARR